MTSFAEETRIESPSGATLRVLHQPAMGSPRAIVQINHGLAEHAARYAPFAAALAAAGIHVYAHDHRGHGGTTAPDAPQRIFATGRGGADKVLMDVAAVQDHATTRHSGLPLIVFGHSMGGLISMNNALNRAERLAGAAVWNANFSNAALNGLAKALLAFERLRLGSDVESRILPRLTFDAWAKQVKNRRTEFDWLSNIPSEVDAYVSDPLCGWNASVGMWDDLFTLTQRGGAVRQASAAAKALPFHLLGGSDDPATFGGRATRAHASAMKSAGFAKVDAMVLDGIRHETLNDITASDVTAQFIGWIDDIIAV